MITKIELWRTDDGKDFSSEVEALRHENQNLRDQLDKLNWQLKCQPNATIPISIPGPTPNDVSGVIFVSPAQLPQWRSGMKYGESGSYNHPSSTGYCGDLDYNENPGIGPFPY